MTWRIHFTPEDLARTRVDATLGPLAETMFGMSLLYCRRQRPAGFERWRRRSRSRVGDDMRPLMRLLPPGSVGVDLWTLTGEASTIGQGLRALLAMPRDRVQAEMEVFARHTPLDPSAWRLSARTGSARAELADSALAAYRGLVEPHWPRLEAHLRAERTSRGLALLDGGVDRLLSTICPDRVRWRMPVLELSMPTEADLYLGGRGLRLVPSVFVGELPMFLEDVTDRTAPPRLVFPALRDTALLEDDQPRPAALAALVGRTRAAALRTIAAGCTTTELARSIGVSAAAASQHTTVLREAGLISTRREGGTVWHTLTPLGASLLDPR